MGDGGIQRGFVNWLPGHRSGGRGRARLYFASDRANGGSAGRFDKNPPPTAYYGSGTSAGYYYEFADNPVGRYFTLGFRFSLLSNVQW
jgi:hypothetical protein